MSIGLVIAAAAGASHLFTGRTTAATAAAPNMNCTLIVPANPLTAQGLATPYQLTATNPADGACNEANANQTAFVQGAVLNPATGQIAIYNPLVVDQGTQPAEQPVVPPLPRGAVVALWFGYNGNTLSFEGADQAAPTPTGSATPTPTGPATATPSGSATATPSGSSTATPTATPSPTGGWYGHHYRHGGPRGRRYGWQSGPPTSGGTPVATTPPANIDTPAASGTPDVVLQQAHCIAGEDIQGQFSSFTQVGACNAIAFFRAANAAVRAGKLRVPSPGTAVDGQSCLTTRSFDLIDQDQSDNVTAEYLANANGQIAQDTAANQQALAGATTLFNGSDNGLLDFFVDPALGCTPWKAPDLADNGTPATGLPLDELQAAMYAGHQGRRAGPAALVPLNDPMTLDDNGNFSTDKTNTYRSIVDMPPLAAGQSPRRYCADMENIQGRRLQQDVNLLINKAGPLPGVASNLFTFLAMRLQQSFMNLNCQNFGLRSDVSTTVDGNGTVVAACFLNQVSPVTAGAGNPTAGMTVCPASTASTASASASASASVSASVSPSVTAVPSGTADPSTSPAPSASAVASASAVSSASTGPSASPSPTSAAPGGQARHHHHWWW